MSFAPVLDHTDLVSSDTERVVVCHDRPTGMRAVIAIDDTTLGPGLGGVRWMPYESEDAASTEARRLARGMTLKNALATIPYGGAKSVIIREEPVQDRRALMEAFGRFVNRLGGSYVPGVDMGTTVADLATIHTVAPDVSCDHQDPSPWTALGIFSGIVAAVRHTDGTALDGHRVVVQGAGHVGGVLAHYLAAAGAEVIVADIDEQRAKMLAAKVGGAFTAAGTATGYRCDVFAPCATARMITPYNIESLGCRIVAGGANDVLAARHCATLLAERGVTYVPDFLINAGGVIQIHALRSGWDNAQLRGAVMGIADRVALVLERAEASGSTPIDVAEEIASERLGRPLTIPA